MKQPAANGLKFLNAICDALGLSQKVRAVKIRVDMDNVAIVEVEEVMSAGDATAVEVVLTEYELVERCSTTHELDDLAPAWTIEIPASSPGFLAALRRVFNRES